MNKFLIAAILCLLCVTCAKKKSEENWVQFYTDTSSPSVVLHHYYDAGGLQTSGYLSWKKVRARVKMTTTYFLEGKFVDSEPTIALLEDDCAKKTMKIYKEDGTLVAHINITSEQKAAEAFHRLFCQ